MSALLTALAMVILSAPCWAGGAPTISSITPYSGSAGTAVTINGANFASSASGDQVRFTGSSSNATISSATTTQIVAIAPVGVATGPITVTVNNKTGSSGVSFIVPTLSGFSPASGAAGTTVTISGTNFDPTPANDAVTFNGVTTTVSSATATQLVVTVPSTASTGLIGVRVNGGGTVYSNTNFIVPVTISTVNPASGPVGMSITLSGAGFSSTASNNCVTFNGGECAVVSTASPAQLTAYVPSAATSGPLCVTVNGGLQGCASSNFTVVPITITSFSPTSGADGTSVTITGTGFDPTATNNRVSFSGQGTATVTSATGTQLVTSVPYGAVTGPIALRVDSGPSVVSSGNFTVPLPTITSFSPSSAQIGASMTITGTGFSTVAANNLVRFGGATATISSATSTQLNLAVPNNNSSGDVATGPISISTDNGQNWSASASNFTLLPPTITGFSPTSGPGGTLVTITGNGFDTRAASNEVYFGAASDYSAATAATQTQISAAVRGGATTGPICVALSLGQRNCSSATFTVTPPVVTGFSPASGPMGTTVTITGTGFASDPGYENVMFNGASVNSVTSTTPTQIVAAVPWGATTGPICVVTTSTSCSSNNFVVPLPTITSFSPASGSSGTSLTINGTGFSTTIQNNQVQIGGVAIGNISSATSTKLVVTVSSSAVTGPVSVSVNGGPYVNSATEFSMLPLTISGFSPNAGPMGTTVAITGTGFSSNPANNRVTFNGTVTTVTSASPTQINAIAPSGVTTGPIGISVNGGTVVNTTSNFTAQGPSITGFSPTSGKVGTAVTITGSGFDPAPGNNVVTFSGVAANVTSASATQLVAVVPWAAYTGQMGVAVNGGMPAYSITSFTVPLPTITSFTPTSGGKGTVVTITGTNFDPVASNETLLLNLGSSGVVSLPISSASTTQLVATIPYGATSGLISVSVDGSAFMNSSGTFTVPLPSITGFTPTTGPVGTVVTISGTGFDPTAANDQVTLTGSAGSTVVAPISSASTTQLVVTIPWGTYTSPLGVSVNGGTLVNSSTNFTVPEPTITSFTPTSGALGTTVTITGTNFDPTPANNALYFNSGGVAATVSSASSTQLVTSVPWGANTGTLAVSVNGGHLAHSSTNFTVSVATLTGFSPTSGTRGTTVTITGTNFDAVPANDSVRFNGAGAVVTSASATQLVTTVPYGATTGVLDLSVDGGTRIQSSTNFTVPAPTITSFSPTSGQIGTALTVSGSNFDPVAANNTVTFVSGSSTVSARSTSASSTQLVVAVPPCATAGAFTVIAGGGPSVSSGSSFFTIAAPTITSFAPVSGPWGASVTISGTNFSPLILDNQLTLNGALMTVNRATPTQLTAVVPTAASTGPFQLSIAGCSSATSSSNFSIGPGINGFTPSTGQGGTSVTIYGSGFDTTATNDAVSFNGVAATVTSASASQLIATAPSGVTSGPISVTVAGQTATSKGLFSVAPTITAFAPNSGPAGTSVTITGSGFSTTPANNAVAFNGMSATVNSATSTQLTVTVPTGATTGPIGLGVGSQAVASKGSFIVTGATTPTSYQYDANGRLQQVAPSTGSPSQYAYEALGNLTGITSTPASALTIFSIAPGQGAAGDAVTIVGQGFDVTAGNDQVSFNGRASTVLSATATQLVVTVPAGVTTGTVSVTVGASTANSPALFVATN